MLSWLSTHFSLVPATWLSYIGLLLLRNELVFATSVIAGSITPAPTLPSFALASPNPLALSKPTTLVSAGVPPPQKSHDALSQPVNPPALSAAVTNPPSGPQPPKSLPKSDPEPGKSLGNLVIKSSCSIPLYLISVGSHPLGGPRTDAQGWASKEDSIVHTLSPGGSYTEPYRSTCASPNNATTGYCASHDTLYGQGVSIKISSTNTNASFGGDITQFEYALVKDPKRVPPSTFERLEYDVSLLDCANPFVYPKLFKVNIPPAAGAANEENAGWRDATALTDTSASVDDHKIKVQKCPGYQGGIGVSFPEDKKGVCKAIGCDGREKCFEIYTFDRTREGEASLSCGEEYRGDTVVELCKGMEK
jgi:hypothetical protein